jgi:hypothetical protein
MLVFELRSKYGDAGKLPLRLDAEVSNCRHLLVHVGRRINLALWLRYTYIVPYSPRNDRLKP